MVATLTAYILGIATGILVMKDRIDEKYRRIAQEEIDSVKETFARNRKPSSETAGKPPVSNQANYPVHREDFTPEKSDCPVSKTEKPYVISPDEFGELGDYDTISLTYFSDGVLTDENDEPLDNPDELVGLESLTHFGEYEEDSVFVRNDAKKCDYEILFDLRSYTEFLDTMPPV